MGLWESLVYGKMNKDVYVNFFSIPKHALRIVLSLPRLELIFGITIHRYPWRDHGSFPVIYADRCSVNC